MRPVRIIAAVVLTAAVAATGSFIARSTSRPSATPRPVSSAPLPAITAPPVRPVPNPPRMTTPARAAQHLLRAWQAHDRAAALQGASAQAVDAVFAHSPGSLRNPSLTGCANRDGGYDCAYSAGLTWLRLRVEGGASAGYRVRRAMFGDRISDPATAAWRLYRAWAAGDYWAATQHGISIDVAGGASVGYGIAKVETYPLPAPVPLADGRYDALIRQVDTRNQRLVVDLVQVFHGQAATDAAIADGMPRGQAQYLDVWVRNHNPRLRTLAWASDLRMDLLPGDCMESHNYQFAKLIKDSRAMSNSRHAYYFTLTVAGGAVHRIQEDKTFQAC